MRLPAGKYFIQQGRALIVFLAMSGTAMQLLAQDHNSSGKAADAPAWTFSAVTGFFREDFRWSIAGSAAGTHPDIYSELVWKHLSGPSMAGAFRWKARCNFFLSGHFRSTFLLSGNVTDTDYQGDHRTLPSFSGVFDAGKGSVQAFRLAAGYGFPAGQKLRLWPQIGYGITSQRLYLLGDASQSGSAPDSRYRTDWKGWLAGLDMEWALCPRLSIIPSLYYHQQQYDATADWNLIDLFRHPVSFEDEARGFTLESAVRLRYRISHRWAIEGTAGYIHARTGTGSDRLYLADGRTMTTQFNGAVRKAYTVQLGATVSLFSGL